MPLPFLLLAVLPFPPFASSEVLWAGPPAQPCLICLAFFDVVVWPLLHTGEVGKGLVLCFETE